jgi:quercetin dioxygenase-like cupin family protein
MKAYRVVAWVSFVVLGSVTVLAQDPVKVASANYKVVAENATVRVLKVTVPPGGKTAMHSHPENLVVALSASRPRFTMPDGKTVDADLANESAMFMSKEAHSGHNPGSTTTEAIIVEFKSAKPGTATLPSTRDNLAIKQLAEGPRAVVYRATADPAFHEPAGTKHEYDQVVIALGGEMSLSIDGKPAKTKWARGDVAFIPRGTAHESKHPGGKPTDFIIVAIR